ncbi:MAG TPA: efflux RND transporter periplasmic adaptor subunit, partial [Opitutaceae bacterium]|nr:efflux RND transporter periplasmic adaptor subunit [Opitutaceae bacterium]
MKESEATAPGGVPLQGESRIRSGLRKHPVLSVAALVVLLVCGLLFVHGLFTPKARPPASAVVPVSTGLAKLGDIGIYLDALGTVTPVYTVTVASRVAGELTDVYYKEGQMVRKNDPLAAIDPRPYQALLLQAQGQLARDQALLKNARLDLGRYQNAFEQRAIPEQQLATQQALVDQDAGVVELDQGNLAAAQVNVDYTRIVSPIDGRVGLRTVDPGNIVPANGSTGLATVTQLQPITVIFDISEDDLPQVTDQLSAGRTLSVTALDRSQQHKLAEGTLITVDNQINPATGTVRARATFANGKNELFPNQFVNARLLVRTLTKVDLVPAAAIQRNNDTTFVYVVQPGDTVQSRNVKVIATEGDFSAVTGVVPGEQLVTDGFDRLQSGSTIVIRQAQPAAAPA